MKNKIYVSICEYSGLEIRSSEKWIFRDVNSNYFMKIRLIGNNILDLELNGTLTHYLYIKQQEFILNIIEELFQEDKHFSIIHNYKSLIVNSLSIRAEYIKWVLSLYERLDNICFYNLSNIQKIYIKSGQLFSTKFNKVKIFSNYKDVILYLINQNISNNNDIDNVNISENNTSNELFNTEWQKEKKYFILGNNKYRVVYKQSWSETFECGFEIETKIIDGHIFLRKYSGYLNSKLLVEKLANNFNKIRGEILPHNIKPYFIFDITNVTNSNLEARKATVDWFFLEKNNIKNFIFFGQNTLVELALKFSKLINPKLSQVILFSNINEIFNFIFDENKIGNTNSIKHKLTKKQQISFLKSQIEEKDKIIENHKTKLLELFQILGRISWDNTYKDSDIFIDENDDFSDVFNVVNMLHADIKEIISEKESFAQKAIEADKLKSVFLANMSHEIRTPMNAISGFSDILISNNNFDDESKEYLNIIKRNSNKLLLLINDIIDFSKIEANQIKISNTKNNINAVIKDVISTFKANKKLGYEINLENLYLDYKLFFENDDESEAIFDDLRISQVLTNLVGNAIKFTEDGGILVSYEIIKTNNEDFIEFSVNDTGIGISLEKLERIFKRFQQADDSTTRLYGGTGLGLSICKGLVNLMGGEIKVNSEVRIGSEFIFTIPYIKP